MTMIQEFCAQAGLVRIPAEPIAVRDLYAQFPSGVVALGAKVGAANCGMAVSSFTAISIDPVLIAVSIRAESETWPLLQRAPAVGVSLLADGQGDLARQMASKGASGRFVGVDPMTTESGALLIPGAVSWMETTIENIVEAGDHLIAVLRVHSSAHWPSRGPLVFHRSCFASVGSS